MKKHALPFLFALLAGCAVSPQYDAHFGDAVREARLQMTLHPRPLPDANDASTMTGPAARAAMQQYQDSFKTPPPVVNVINISGVAGHSGSQ